MNFHIWIMILVCVLPTILLLLRRNRFFRPSAINGLMLVPLLLFIHYSERDPTLILSTSCFLLFLAGPLFLQKKISGKVLNHKYPQARRWLYLLKLISPAFSASEYLTNLKILEKSLKDIPNENALLELKTSSLLSVTTCVQIHLLSVNWTASERWLSTFSQKEIQRMPWLSLLRIRLYCEKGEIDAARDFIQEINQRQEQRSYYIFHLIYLCSFTGDQQGLMRILAIDPSIPEKNRDFWKSVCLYNCTETRDSARFLLERLAQSDDIRMARSSSSILEHNLPPSTPVPDLQKMINELEVNYEDYCLPPPQKYPLTISLIGVNLIIFGLTTVASGSQYFNPATDLLDPITDLFGMKLPEMIETNEYWRMLTTTFLHGSLFHLLSNMTVILFFGILLERCFSAINLLKIYLIPGILGMIVVTLASLQEKQLSITVGASGSAMALLGAYLAVLLRQNQRSSLKLRQRQMLLLLCFLGFQSYIDLKTPQISFTAHFVGLVSGLLMAYFLYTAKNGKSKLESISETNK